MHRNYKTAQHATECDDSGCVVGHSEVIRAAVLPSSRQAGEVDRKDFVLSGDRRVCSCPRNLRCIDTLRTWTRSLELRGTEFGGKIRLEIWRIVAVALLFAHTRQGLIASSIALSLNSRGFNECGWASRCHRQSSSMPHRRRAGSCNASGPLTPSSHARAFCISLADSLTPHNLCE